MPCAIYLIHPAVIVLLLPFARALARLHIPHAWSLSVLLAIPVILILSWWTHHAFERPARHWVREALAGKAKKGVLF
jgi:peptidoglycan/LPS O-acetylase OafA/YrhL